MESMIPPPPRMIGIPPGPLQNAPFQGIMKPYSHSIINPALLNEQEQKKKEFARGVFVSGFEKCVTTAMIQHHFNIKPIFGLRHPTTKFKESKGFAFIYYGTEDDALYVKKTLDRTAILKDKVRITRTVISENLSKMMIKLKTHGLSQKEVIQNEAKYFNDQNLEKEVQRIIKPHFGNSVEVNKIAIPYTKVAKKYLRYARILFYVRDLKEGSRIATLANDAINPDPNKNQYQRILNYINELLKNDATFNKYCISEVYSYSKKNQLNVLHIKGIKHNPNEDPTALAEEIREFLKNQNPQCTIVDVYAAFYSQNEAWSNVTFSTSEETIQAYNSLKINRTKFRDGLVYGSLRNVNDPRTVVISEVRQDATEELIQPFFTELASRSAQNSAQLGQEPTKKYDYFSFNIVQRKKYYVDDDDKVVCIVDSDIGSVQPYWMLIREVPRRLIIHFIHDLLDKDIRDLNNQIQLTQGYGNIFLSVDSKRFLRSNHQKGHFNSDGYYVRHTELKGRKGQRRQNNNRNNLSRTQRNNDPNNPIRKWNTRPVQLGKFSFKQNFGVPMGGQPMTYNRTQVPQLGVGQIGQMLPNPSDISGRQMGVNMSGMPMGIRPPQPPTFSTAFGSQPPMGGLIPPMSGQPMGFKPPGFPSMPSQGIPGIIPSLKPPMMQNFPPQNPIGLNLPKPQPK